MIYYHIKSHQNLASSFQIIIFMKILLVLHEVANGQTDRQTDRQKGRQIPGTISSADVITYSIYKPLGKLKLTFMIT